MTEPTRTARPPLWRDVRVLRWVFQLVIVGTIFAIGWWAWGNYIDRTGRQGIPRSYDFLDNPATFQITGNSLSQNAPVRDALYEGLLNTLRVAVAGVVAATVLGTLIGIARLSKNWLLSKMAATYVETVRNIPLLLFLLFANAALVRQVFPSSTDAWEPLGVAVMSNRGIGVPWFRGSGYALVGFVVLAVAAAWAVARWRRAVADRSGALPRTGLWGSGAGVVILVAGWLTAGLSLSVPEVSDQSAAGFVGGIRTDPSFFALFVALTIYTASHIAEIVRGSIQAVPRGQPEAASALALSGFQRMWYVVLPQAFRIAIPPIGNQHLNLLKNSSLGAAIGYFDLTMVAKTTQAAGSPSIPVYALIMGFYIAVALVISILVNLANRRFQLVTR